jgi:hypothetical protein
MGWRTGRGEYELEQLYTAYKDQSYSTVRVRFLKFEPAAPGVRFGCGIRKLQNEAESTREFGAVASLRQDVDIFDPDVQKQFATRLLVKFLGTALVVRKIRPSTLHGRILREPSLALPPTPDLTFECLAAGWSEARSTGRPQFKATMSAGSPRVQPPHRALRRPREFKDRQAAAASPPRLRQVGMSERSSRRPSRLADGRLRGKGVSTGVHDDLYARSLVIEGVDKTVVMMTLASSLRVREPEKIRARSGRDRRSRPTTSDQLHAHAPPGRTLGAGPAYIELVIDRAKARSTPGQRVPGRVGTGWPPSSSSARTTAAWNMAASRRPPVRLIKVEDSRASSWAWPSLRLPPSTLNLYNLEFTEDWPYAIRDIKKALAERLGGLLPVRPGRFKVGYSAELSAVGAEMPIRSFWYAEVKRRQMAAAVAEALPAS